MYNDGIELDREGKWEKLAALLLSLLTENIMVGGLALSITFPLITPLISVLALVQ
ncbi:MAG: hypothetical protein WCE81_13325 [Halobacteriota archaeon]